MKRALSSLSSHKFSAIELCTSLDKFMQRIVRRLAALRHKGRGRAAGPGHGGLGEENNGRGEEEGGGPALICLDVG